MTHTHYIATPVSEPPKESGIYPAVYGDMIFSTIYNAKLNQWKSGSGEFDANVTHWLKPCTETGAVGEGKFAEWLHLNDWSACAAIGSKDVSWMNLDNEYDPEQHGLPDKEFYTTSELLEIFKAETQKT